MKAIQALKAGPNGKKTEDYLLYTMVLSALMWRRYNGEIKLVTDTSGKKFLTESGAAGAWDEISTLLDDIPSYVDRSVFWAAGKIFALKNEKAPIAVIDTDFIVWKPIKINNTNGIYVIHKENLSDSVYPNAEPYISFDDGFSWSVPPSNAAFYYIGRDDFLKRYTDYAMRFMRLCTEKDTLCPMVFAEQRLFSMTAEKMNIPIDCFSSQAELESAANDTFTHLWGYKSTLEKNEAEKEKFTQKLIQKLKKEFPDFKMNI